MHRNSSLGLVLYETPFWVTECAPDQDIVTLNTMKDNGRDSEKHKVKGVK